MIRTVKNKISYWKATACGLLFPAAFVLLSCREQIQVQRETFLSNETYSGNVDVPARPKGGLDQFYNTIRQSVRYPAEARVNHKYGKVLLQFAVNEVGGLDDMTVLESPGDALSQEAIRVLQLGGEWIPAKNGEFSVRTELLLPIRFKLDYPGMDKSQQPDETHEGDALPSLPEILVVGYTNI